MAVMKQMYIFQDRFNSPDKPSIIIPGIINTELLNPCSIGPSCPPAISTIVSLTVNTAQTNVKQIQLPFIRIINQLRIFTLHLHYLSSISKL